VLSMVDVIIAISRLLKIISTYSTNQYSLYSCYLESDIFSPLSLEFSFEMSETVSDEWIIELHLRQEIEKICHSE